MAIAETLGGDFHTFLCHLFVSSKPTLLHWDVLREHPQCYMPHISPFKDINGFLVLKQHTFFVTYFPARLRETTCHRKLAE